MKSIAEAVVYATTFINLRDDRDDMFLAEDVDALESIADLLSEATEQEKDELAAAAERMLKAEVNGPNREDFVEDLSTWMEDMFGDEWDGNSRYVS